MKLLQTIRKVFTKKRTNPKPNPAQSQQQELDKRLELQHRRNIQAIQGDTWTAESEFQ